MKYLRTIAGGLLTLLAAHVHAEMLELDPDRIRQTLAQAVVEVTVLEPHMKCGETQCIVTYLGIPLGELLQYAFPDTWAGFNGVIHFYAQDGYLAAIDAGMARKDSGYLTFARADGEPFTIDNEAQNEKDVPLAPFYLVWDNLRNPVLQDQGAYRWPYKVSHIELLPASIYDRLLPADATADAREGFVAWKTYCMTCHHIDGVGGRKHEDDMRQLVRGMSRDTLRVWICCPQMQRDETTMPPLSPELDKAEREQIIERILDYLETL